MSIQSIPSIIDFDTSKVDAFYHEPVQNLRKKFDLETIDSITKKTFKELIEQHFDNKIPYLMALQVNSWQEVNYVDVFKGIQEIGYTNWKNELIHLRGFKINNLFLYALKDTKSHFQCLHHFKETEIEKHFDVYLSALLGDVKNQHLVALSYFRQNQYQEALIWFQKAAESGNVDSVFEIGSYYMGLTCRFNKEVNQKKGLSYWEVAAKHGSKEAHLQLSLYYLKLKNPNYLESSRWYRPIAERNEGIGEILSRFGKYFISKNNFKEALYWLEKAKEAGDLQSISLIAKCYRFGQGVSPNLGEAKKLYKVALIKGDQEAKISLKLMNLPR